MENYVYVFYGIFYGIMTFR